MSGVRVGTGTELQLERGWRQEWMFYPVRIAPLDIWALFECMSFKSQKKKNPNILGIP